MDFENVGMLEFNILDVQTNVPNSNGNTNENAPQTEAQPIRFQNVSFGDIDSFLAQNYILNTKRKTNNDIRIIRSHLQNCGENREIASLSAEGLHEMCSTFVLSVRERDEKENEPSTLKCFLCNIDRYLKWHNSKFSLLNGSEFDKCRPVLQSKQKQLKSRGMGTN